MKKVIKDNYKFILEIIGILFVLTLFVYTQYLIHSKYEELPEIKLKEKTNKNKLFAIMISEDGNNYQEYNKDTWPNEGYKFKEAKCTDNNGILVDNAVTFNDGKVTLKTNKTVYCTIYFDYKGTINILRENDPNKVLSSEEIGGMYRYQGVGKEEAIDDTHKLVDNNYICFGTTNKEECISNTEKYMYRIIGITNDGQLKIIKMNRIIETSGNIYFSWHYTYTIGTNTETDCPNEKCPDWGENTLFKRLNGLSNGTVQGAGTTSSNGNSDIFVDNIRYDYLKSGDNINGGSKSSKWYNIIENHDWMYGDIDTGINSVELNNETVYGIRNDGITVFKIETGQLPTQHYEQVDGNWKLVKHQWSAEKSINAKIGLLYIHDYYLAYDNERNFYNDYDTNNWLYPVDYQDYPSAYYRIISRYNSIKEDGSIMYYCGYITPDGSIRIWFGLPSGYAKYFIMQSKDLMNRY